MTYYILEGENARGPFTMGQLRSMWNNGSITGTMMYRREGETQIRPLNTLLDQLEPPPTPPPLPPTLVPSMQPTMVVLQNNKSRGVYIILGLFLGILGVHNFYAGYYTRGFIQLAITFLTGLVGLLFIGVGITGIWALLEIIIETEDSDGKRMV